MLLLQSRHKATSLELFRRHKLPAVGQGGLLSICFGLDNSVIYHLEVSVRIYLDIFAKSPFSELFLILPFSMQRIIH
jgi:hypothetical protein